MAWLIATLLRLARWLGSDWHWVPVADDALYARARALVAKYAQDGPATDGGEWRRAQVYGRLLKEFPAREKRDLGLVIEVAVRHGD